MDKVVLTKAERDEITSLMEEIKARGGMTTEELLVRREAITLEEFMQHLKDKIMNYGR